jgi:hypothetical protein
LPPIDQKDRCLVSALIEEEEEEKSSTRMKKIISKMGE